MIEPATHLPPERVVTYASVVGRVVERLRKQRGKTQEQLGAALGIGQPAYSRLEQGQNTMNVVQLGQVAQQLGITPSEILRQADQIADRLRAEGVEIKTEKEASAAAILIGLGVLAAIFAALK